MHMLNGKRIGILLCVFLLLPIILVVSSVYFFNVNDYSDWITNQIKQTTGYDVRFEHVDNNIWSGNHFSISGLSLYQEQKRVLFIHDVDVQIDSFDLWDRVLAIQSIKLRGVDVDIQEAITPEKVTVEEHTAVTNQLPQTNEVPWKRITVNTFEISDLNALLAIEGKSLLLQEGGIVANSLLLINNFQVQTLPVNVDLSTKLKTLQFKQKNQTVSVDNLQLSTTADLSIQKGELALSADEISVEDKNQVTLQAGTLDLQAQVVGNKLSLQHLSIDAFSGHLALQADAYFSLNLLPSPSINVKRVELLSLTAAGLQLNIPEFGAPNSESVEVADVPENNRLPIEALWIQAVDLKNISVHSEASQLPLTLISADVQISDVNMIQDGRLLDPTIQTQTTKSGTFALAFEYLRWQDTVIEQFSIEGSLNKEDQNLRFIKQLVGE